MSTSPSGEGKPPRRRDAEHNRQHLLTIARAALATSGDTTLQAIAKAAGVGQGTLYRHFPTREALLLEVYRILAAIARLLDAGKAANELRTDIDPDELLPLVSFLWHLDTRHDSRIPHLLDVVVDGLSRRH